MRDCAHNYGPRLALVLPLKLTFAKYMNADDLFEEVHRAMAPHSKESVYNPREQLVPVDHRNILRVDSAGWTH